MLSHFVRHRTILTTHRRSIVFSVRSVSSSVFDNRINMNNSVDQDQETAVGITAFSTQSKGFYGILKHRFADFIVRECDLQGKVSALGSLDGLELERKIWPLVQKEEKK